MAFRFPAGPVLWPPVEIGVTLAAMGLCSRGMIRTALACAPVALLATGGRALAQTADAEAGSGRFLWIVLAILAIGATIGAILTARRSRLRAEQAEAVLAA